MGCLLAPNGRWSARDKVGESAIGAFLYTYINQTRDFKNTFADPSCTIPNPNPLRLDASGTASIYWEDDEFYTYELYSVDPNNDQEPYELIDTEDNYPKVTGGSGGDTIINQTFPNLIRNAQFTRWGNDNYLSSDTVNDAYSRLGFGGTSATFVKNTAADDWGIIRSNNSATFTVSRVQFPLGQNEVPANPVNYLNYTCTGIGAGAETFKSLVQDFIGVGTLSNQEITASFWAKSIDSSTISLDICQSFGTGGAPSTVNCQTIINTPLTPVWTQYFGTIIVDSVAGKSRGTDNNDFFRFEIRLPLNQIANIDICNCQLHQASALPEFAYLPINDQIKRADTTSTNATLPTGSIQAGIFIDAPTGWVLCNDSTIGSFYSGASYAFNETLNLFILLWNSLPDTYAPIFDSAGSPTIRGASAIEDFNADKRLQLISILGRVIGAAGDGVGLTSRALGETLGLESVSLIEDQNGPHSHSYQHVTPNFGSAYWISDGNGQKYLQNFTTGSSGSGAPHENMQPTVFATHMIKL